MTEFETNDYLYIENRDLYDEVILNALLKAKKSVVISTANLKDVRILYRGKYVSIIKAFVDLLFTGVEIRLLHAANPSKPYMNSLKKSTLEKQKNFKRVLCPRVHFKTVIIDGKLMYLGSANMTGAGLGSKSDQNRNFETGMLISDPVMINNVSVLFESIWSGSHCKKCGRRSVCPKPIR